MSVRDTDLFGNTASGDAADDGGGGIFNNGGTLSVDDCSIHGNRATGTSGSGGGIFSLDGDVTVATTSLDGNTASRAGGGVEIVDGSLTISDVSAVGNETGPNPGNGGVVHVTGMNTDVLVSTSAFRGNRAASEGGALWNQSGSLMTVSGCLFRDNQADGDGSDQGGGALFNNGGTMAITTTTIDSNRALGASGSGGGVLNDQGDLTMSSCVLIGNSSSRAGGGIETNIGTVELTGVDLRANATGDSPGNGGGLHISGAGVVTYRSGKVNDNSAANEGGGLWNSSTGVLMVSLVTFNGNAAPLGPDVFTQPGGSTTVN